MEKNKYPPVKDIVLKVSEGGVEKLTDFLLWYFFLIGSSVGKNTRTSYQAFIEADEALAQINYQSFKRAIVHLRSKRSLILKKKPGRLEIEITKEGKGRLERIFPIYQKKRTWDKKLYLVTYDIPEKKRQDRNLLREYLKRIGGAKLQESVWVTVYNPTWVLEEYVKEKGLEGTILVSDLGPQGSIGGEDIKSLIIKIYQLDKLNEKYQQFMEKYSDHNATKTEINFAFYNILKEDPQLPFEILPPDWLGNKAYLLFERKTT